MRSQDLYIESSVWNCCFNDHVPELQQQTRSFFTRLKVEPGVRPFLSDAVVHELANAPEERWLRLLSLILEVAPTQLDIDEEAIRLANAYVKHGVLSDKRTTDARHVAIASVAGLDAIVSWNYRHLVNRRRRDAFNGVNAIMGYRPIDIITPPEVFDE
jgi:predicted nucleic acid-binding protein